MRVGLDSFHLKASLRMATRCQNRYEIYACNEFYFIMCISWLMHYTSICPRHQRQDQSSAPDWTTICTIKLIVTKRNIPQLPHFAMVSTPAILPYCIYNR